MGESVRARARGGNLQGQVLGMRLGKSFQVSEAPGEEEMDGMPGELQRPCRPVVPEPGGRLELPGEVLKFQNAGCDWRKCQGERCWDEALMVSPGD